MSGFIKGKWIACSNGSIDIRDDEGRLLYAYYEVASLHDDKDEMMSAARLIASAPKMYELISSLANLPDEQCIISPMIQEARRLIASIDGTEAQE